MILKFPARLQLCSQRHPCHQGSAPRPFRTLREPKGCLRERRVSQACLRAQRPKLPPRNRVASATAQRLTPSDPMHAPGLLRAQFSHPTTLPVVREQYESVKGLRAHLADSSSGALRVAAAAQRLLKAASNRALTGPNARLGRQVATSQHTWSIHASADLRAQTLLLQTLLLQAELTASQGGEATAASDTAASDTAPSRRRGRPSDRAI